MSKSFPLMLITATIICYTANAQIKFQNTYSMGNNDYVEGRSVQQTIDGGFIIAGKHFKLSPHSTQGFLIKTDDYGNIEWVQNYPNSELESVQQTNDGGFITCGQFSGYSSIMKVDGNGAPIFSYHFGKINHTAGTVIQTSDGGYLLSGPSSNPQSSDANIYLLKFNMNGELLWTQNYSGPGDNSDNINQVIETAEGGFILVGSTRSFTSNQDLLVIKTNDTGDISWVNTYTRDTPSPTHGYAVYQTLDDGYVITGSESSYGFIVLKLNNAGNITWAKDYDNGSGYSITQTNEGQYIVVGETGTTGSDVHLTKIDETGNIVYNNIYGIPNSTWVGAFDAAYCIDNTLDGGFIITGTSDDSIYVDGYRSIYLIKTDHLGNSECFYEEKDISSNVAIFNSNLISFSVTQGMALNQSNATTGFPVNPTTVSHCIQNSTDEIFKNNNLLVYPNPFSKMTTIESSKQLRNASITLTSSSGLVVLRLNGINGHKVIFERGNLPNGIYFAQITQNGHMVSTQRFVVTD